MKRHRIIHLMGPTASGKTDFAIALARELPIEVISVDSALVYRGLDIGSAKPSANIRAEIPHHLIDIISPEDHYSVANFLQDARKAIADIHARGKIPLLVGGTMLYFKALLEGLANIPSIASEIRNAVQQKLNEQGSVLLHQELQQVDSYSASRIHANDTQRVTRALEVFYGTGRPLTYWLQLSSQEASSLNSILQLSLIPQDRNELHEILAKRFYAMLEQGFVAEVQSLQANYLLNPDLSAMRCVGYRQVWQYLAGEINHESMVNAAIAASRQLAKRQLTWLRSWQNHEVVFAYQANTYDEMRSKIASWLGGN
jgi:tRNA dimethylallyltransferase